jgi:hypothetical protein
MGMPGFSQTNFRELVLDNFDKKFLTESVVDMVQTPGFPIMIYPRLSSEWLNCGQNCEDLVDNIDIFLPKVQEIFQSVESAGLIHLDGRLFNFMFRITAYGMEVKLIDWDSCSRIGDSLPGALINAFNSDPRFPDNVAVADKSIHDHFYLCIQKEIQQAATPKNKKQCLKQG